MRKYPTPMGLAEMKARGYDSATIAAAAEQGQRGIEAQRITDAICAAFAGVTLGSGVGLRETRALDDYEDAAVCAAVRAGDEKDDWQQISARELNAHQGLSFFDAEGMRFHLPAFIVAHLSNDNDNDDCGLIYCLTDICDLRMEQFSLLSSPQRCAVREYLIFMLDDPDESFHREEIQRALDGYWTDKQI